MKRLKPTPLISYLAVRALFFMALMALWYFRFPHFLRSIEEEAFWADTPDVTHIMFHWPADWFALLCQYFSQFFASRLCGAALMALGPLLLVLLLDLIVAVWRRHRKPSSSSPSSSSVFVIVAQRIVAQRVAIVLVTILVIVFATSSLGQREQTARIEHMAADHQWRQLLDETYTLRHELDDNLMAYSLLALSEEGQLANRLFHYPVRSIDNVFAHDRNFRFNSFFCHELHLPNEAIRYAFEEGQYMPAGASFGTIRRMVDWILEKGDDPELAEFYLNLLSHTTCHDAFIATRRIFMMQKPLKQREVEPEFVGSPSFLYEAALVLEREPDNLRARDYLLCGLLLTGNVEAFYDVFQRIFVETNDAAIPTHYYEALLMLKAKHPEIDSSYNIPIGIESQYRKFQALAAQGQTGKAQAAKLYPETYWAYLQRLAKSQQQGPQTEIKITGTSHFD